MALKSIEEEWQFFAAIVFSKHQPSETQRREMRKAFVAGAWSLLIAMREIGEPHVTEEEGLQYLAAREAECLQFKADLMREYGEGN